MRGDVQTVQFALFWLVFTDIRGWLQVITHSSVPIIIFVFVSFNPSLHLLRSLRFNFVTRFVLQSIEISNFNPDKLLSVSDVNFL